MHGRDDPGRGPRRSHAAADGRPRRRPLLPAGGKPLIVWQIEALARAGFRDIVINAAWLAPQTGRRPGRWRCVRRAHPLVARALSAGNRRRHRDRGATAPSGSRADRLRRRLDAVRLCDARGPAPMPWRATRSRPRVHLVMVPNPAFHPDGDFVAGPRPHRRSTGGDKLTFGNIGLYDTALFRELPRGVKLKLLPLYRDWIARGWVCGERFDGPWANVGTPDDLAALDRRLRTESLSPRVPATRNDIDALETRCSIFPDCRASTRSAPRTSRPPSTRCSTTHAPRSNAWRRTREPATWDRVVEPIARTPSTISTARGAPSPTSTRS